MKDSRLILVLLGLGFLIAGLFLANLEGHRRPYTAEMAINGPSDAGRLGGLYQ